MAEFRKFGIDISSHQKGIDFYKVKNEGVEFAIIRAGFTGYGDGISKNKDKDFEIFYQQCKSLNIPVGTYWYSCANTYEKGLEEAKWMYENCLKGKRFEYPIYIDVEDKYHQQPSGKKNITEAIKGFLEYLENMGYYVGIYANSNWFRNYINLDEVARYDKWIASWSKNRPTFINYGIWQFGGETNFIRSNKIAGKVVDQDYAYKDYPKIIKDNKLNGFKDGYLKPLDEIAMDVIAGLYGNGEERKKLLESAGYDYYEVQKRVNEILNNQNNYYVVKPRDNLYSLAKKYNTTVNRLIELNKDRYPTLVNNPFLIYSGWELKIR